MLTCPSWCCKVLKTYTSMRRGYFLDFLKFGGKIIWYQKSAEIKKKKKTSNIKTGKLLRNSVIMITSLLHINNHDFPLKKICFKIKKFKFHVINKNKYRVTTELNVSEFKVFFYWNCVLVTVIAALTFAPKWIECGRLYRSTTQEVPESTVALKVSLIKHLNVQNCRNKAQTAGTFFALSNILA